MESTKIVERQKAFFTTGQTKDTMFRKKALHHLEKIMKAKEPEILAALKTDLNKAGMESYMTELGLVYHSIHYAKTHLELWAMDQTVPTPISLFAGKSYMRPEPYGTVLVMSPWNYPFLLCMDPLIGAIAAGNCVVVKPSAYAPAVSKVIHDLIQSAFPMDYVAVMEGGRAENEELLELRWDYIFFTGSVSVGKLVMEKASKNLTPVTLELGGKSPCIVDASADLNMAAKRIVFGKFVNCGQTCIAPDYVLVQEYVREEFLKQVKKWIRRMLGENPLDNSEYPKMINRKHYDRVMGLIQNEKVFVGGEGNGETLKIAPTVLDLVSGEAPVMQEEIFGPVLPILTYYNLSEAEDFILKREKPLAFYVFTGDPVIEQRLLDKISFGGGCINDTLMHIANPNMGFGGVGYSGMGQYHGKLTFDTFTHKKSIIKRSTKIDLPMRYHPYTSWKEKLIRMVVK